MVVHTHMVRADMDISVEQMGEPCSREVKSLDQSQIRSPEPQWWVCKSPIPSSTLSQPCLHPLHRDLVTTLCHKFPLTSKSGSMCTAFFQAFEPSASKPLTRTNRLQATMPNAAVPERATTGSVWAHLPPYHSKGQPHRSWVVDDVSSHLGLQEGALGQAPVLVSRDLLGHPRERDLSATEPLSVSFLPATTSIPVHMTIMWKGNQAHSLG